MMKHFLIPLLLLTVWDCLAQCGPYKHHPLWPDTLGRAYVNDTECLPFTDLAWSNGSITWQANDLPPGPHYLVFYQGPAVLDTVHFEIEQLHWNLNHSVLPSPMGLEVSVWAEVPYCGTQIFNHIACPPDPTQTTLYLLQNGVAIDSISPVNCTAFTHWWWDMPFGFTYQTMVVDDGPCGSIGFGQLVATYDCTNTSFDMVVEDASGGANGSITVFGLVPDPSSPMPPPLPLTGTFSLYAMPDFDPVGDPFQGTDAFWDGLPAGEYIVVFGPDVLCNPVEQTVVVDQSTALPPMQGGTAEAPLLWPVPAQDELRWSGTPRAQVRVTDLLGRELLWTRNADRIDVSSLAHGSYLLYLDDARPQVFLKQ